MKNLTCIRVEADIEQINKCKVLLKDVINPIKALAQILNLAGNEVRLKILYLLYQEKELCVCDLSDILQMKVAAISQHLRKLKDRNLIKSVRDGQILYYRLEPFKLEVLKPLLDSISHKTLEQTTV